LERPLEFDHEYATCTETFSTLRIFSNDVAPEGITSSLEIEPTDSFRKGDSFSRGKLVHKYHGWFLETRSLSDSRDFGYHLELILGRLDGKAKAVAELHARGCELGICSFWMGIGQGGPNLHPAQMRRLGALGISVWWDIYFDQEKVLTNAVRAVAAEMPDDFQRKIVEQVEAKIDDYFREKYAGAHSPKLEGSAELEQQQ
jgi:hypothetical protein